MQTGHASQLAILIVIPFSLGYSQGAFGPPAAQLHGFHGPIHTQKIIERQLNEDPRSKPRLEVRNSIAWFVFDASGNEAEAGDVDESGQAIVWSRNRFLDGMRRIETMRSDAHHETSEFDWGPFGWTENRQFEDGKLWVRTTQVFSKDGDLIEDNGFDGDGKSRWHAVYHHEPNVTEDRSWGVNGVFTGHSLERFDDDGYETERIIYDEKGDVIERR